jgi:hypothetical protein
MQKITKSELVTINVPTGTTATKFYFPDNSVLRTSGSQLVKTKGIEFYPSQAVALSPDGVTNMSSGDLCSGYLVLYIDDAGGEYVKIPLNHLISVANNTTTAWPGEKANYPHVMEIPELENLMVNWPKSYVFFPAALTATGVAMVCTVYYDFNKR